MLLNLGILVPIVEEAIILYLNLKSASHRFSQATSISFKLE